MLKLIRGGISISLLIMFSIVSVYADEDSESKYQGVLNYVESMGRDIYCYWDLKKEHHNVDWDKIIQNARVKISDTTTENEFHGILREVAASVKDGHVNYINRDKKTLFYLPIEVNKIDSDYYISKIDHDKMSLFDADLKVGDKILLFDGQDIKDYVATRMKYSTASREDAAYSYMTSALHTWPYYFDTPTTTVKLTVERDSKLQTINTELPWLIYNYSKQSQASYARPLDAVVQARILPGNIGLLTLGAMYSDEGGLEQHIAYISEKMQLLKNTKALIIDVRNNGGGSGDIGDSVVSKLIDKDVLRYKKQLKNSMQLYYARPRLLQDFSQTNPAVDVYSEWQDAVIKPADESQKYTKPVFVLVNERCFSACDTFVDSFSSNKLGEVLGAQSGGGTGYPLWIGLPWDMGNFRFSVMRGYSNHDRYLEGTGTIPDVEIKPDVASLRQGVDGELLKAFQYVNAKVNPGLGIKSNQNGLIKEFAKTEKDSSIVPYDVIEEFWFKAQAADH